MYVVRGGSKRLCKFASFLCGRARDPLGGRGRNALNIYLVWVGTDPAVYVLIYVILATKLLLEGGFFAPDLFPPKR